MSHEGGKMLKIESQRLSINEHMTLVGEEISCVLEKQQSDVCSAKLNVRVFVSERLRAAAEFMCNLFQREMEALETELERQDKLLDVILHHIKLHRKGGEGQPTRGVSMGRDTPDSTPLHDADLTSDQCVESSLQVKMRSPEPAWIVSINQQPEDLLDTNFLHLPMCKEEVSPEQQERRSSLVQEEPEAPQIKEEQEELLKKTEADGSMLTLLAGKDFLHLPVCKEVSPEQQERRSSLVQEEPEAPQIKEEQEELLQRPEEADGSMLTLLAVKSESEGGGGGGGDDDENGDTEPLASTSKEYMKTQANEKPLTCTVCGNSFAKKYSLERHMIIHTGEKPFTCTVCGKGYAHRYHLKSHMRTHTGEKPCTCIICGKGFGNRSQLKTHMRIHTGEKPFTCTVCGKGCTQRGKLKTHMRIHTGEKPFTCTVCGKGCTQRGALKSHMRIHTVLRPGLGEPKSQQKK